MIAAPRHFCRLNLRTACSGVTTVRWSVNVRFADAEVFTNRGIEKQSFATSTRLFSVDRSYKTGRNHARLGSGLVAPSLGNSPRECAGTLRCTSAPHHRTIASNTDRPAGAHRRQTIAHARRRVYFSHYIPAVPAAIGFTAHVAGRRSSPQADPDRQGDTYQRRCHHDLRQATQC